MIYIKLTRPITGAVVDLLNEKLKVRYDCVRQTVPGTANSYWLLTVRDPLSKTDRYDLICLLEAYIPDFERRKLTAAFNLEKRGQ